MYNEINFNIPDRVSLFYFSITKLKLNPMLKHIFFPFKKATYFLKQYLGYMQGSGVKVSVCKSESPNYTNQQEQIMSHNIPYFHFSCYFMAVRVGMLV